MQAKKRYLLLFSCCAFLSFGYFGYHHFKMQRQSKWYEHLSSYSEDSDVVHDEDISPSPRLRHRRTSRENDDTSANKECRMETCFDFTLCEKGFKVYVYPVDDNAAPSSNYMKVLNAIQDSNYYTSDPSQACIFVLSLDTLDRDTLSKDYIRNMPHRIQRLPLWNGGQNHIIFNLYSGTFPDYNEDLGFDVGKAILAKASISYENFRSGFDISLPLFHKTHPERGGDDGYLESNKFPGTKKYLLSFKGKRYVYGIGSETRNSLYHLHNERDIVLLTTCKHGDSWKEYKDERCDHDNAEYDRYDYEVLMRNSTFCLVPRGRRLGSFRFLEVLQAGCIPVLLANGWELPFSEVIDWSQSTIGADERLLLQIVADRVRRHRSRPLSVWNSSPGALAINLTFSDYLPHFPFYLTSLGTTPSARYTAVISVSHGGTGAIHTSPLYKLVKNIARSKFVERIVVVWSSNQAAPTESRLPGGSVPVHVVVSTDRSTSARHSPHPLITTDAVFSLDEDVSLTTDELDFAFTVWRTFPDRIVGYPARSHHWDDSKAGWSYTSRWTNSYSLVLTGAAVYHRYWQHVYTHQSPSGLLSTVKTTSNCDDILMNFLVSAITRRPPIKLTQRKQYKDNTSEARWIWTDPTHFHQRTVCMNTFVSLIGHMPLRHSNLRLDPVLFKDKVSMQRKKYRQIEKIGS
nr:exostosin-1-like isoform X2 [Procambarus clarkii]